MDILRVAEWEVLIEDLLPRDGVIDDKCSLANEIAYMIVEKLKKKMGDHDA